MKSFSVRERERERERKRAVTYYKVCTYIRRCADTYVDMYLNMLLTVGVFRLYIYSTYMDGSLGTRHRDVTVMASKAYTRLK